MLSSFTPGGIGNLLPLDDLLDSSPAMVIVFGLSFELPLLLVMLNFTGVLTGRRMLGWWRAMIMGITVFAAVATPTTDPVAMLALAGPIRALLHRRRLLPRQRHAATAQRPGPGPGRRRGVRAGPEAARPVSAALALPEQSSPERDRVNGYDDVT